MQHGLSFKLKELEEINKTRKLAGLAPLKMGHRKCLRCDKEFFSEDMKNQHNCYYCRRDSNIDQLRDETRDKKK